MSIESLLTQECTIKRWTPRTKDSNFEVAPASYATIAENVPCLIQHKGTTVKPAIAGQKTGFAAVGFFMPDVDLRPGPADAKQADQVVLTAGGTGTFFVRGAMDESGQGKLLTVQLETV